MRWRTNELVFEDTVESSYRAHWVGVTPDMIRAGIAGPIGVARDSAIAPIGGALGGIALGYYVNENLAVSILDAPVAGWLGAGEAASIGGPERAGAGFNAAFATAVAVGTARGRFTDLEAMLAGGAILGAGAAAGPDTGSCMMGEGENTSGVFNGTTRRRAATQGLLNLAFDKFMAELSQNGSVKYKTAVSCRSMNPQGRRGAQLVSTSNAYAVDCASSNYNSSPTTRVYPSRF